MKFKNLHEKVVPVCKNLQEKNRSMPKSTILKHLVNKTERIKFLYNAFNRRKCTNTNKKFESDQLFRCRHYWVSKNDLFNLFFDIFM